MLKAFKNVCLPVLLLSLIAGYSSLYAQESPPKVFEITKYEDRRVTIPFRLINNLIVIEAHINNSTPMKFILDSGASGNIITSLYEEELYLNNVNMVRVAGLGEGSTLEAFQSIDNSIHIGNRIAADSAEVLLLNEDVFQLDSFMGTRIHGILGHDFFESFAVEINYRRKLLRIYEPDAFKEKFRKLPKHRKWHTLPILVQNNKSYLTAEYQHKPGDDFVSLRLLLDTGASNSFSLYDSKDERIKVPEVTINSIIGTGLSGKVTGELGRVQSMKLGDFIFEEPVVAFPDSLSVRRVLRAEERKGSIGGDIFRRFKVIFHYDNELLYLRTNSNFNDEFFFNTSGIEIYTPIPDLPLYVVAYVREGSPAFLAGVQEGDIIKKINGTPAVNLSMNDLIDYFQYKKRSNIYLEVERDSTVKNLRFRMDAQLVPDS